MKKKIGSSKSIKKYTMAGEVDLSNDSGDPFNTKAKRKLDRVRGRYKKVSDKIEVAEDAGVSSKPRLVNKKERLQNKANDMMSTMRFSPLTGYYKKGGSIGTSKKPKMSKSGSTSFGMLSVKKGIDKNPKPTAADRIAGATMKKGGMVKKSSKKK